MKNNRVLFATLVVLLWTVNALDLQPYEFELRSTVAISKHRVPLLRNLAGERNSTVTIAGQSIGMRLVSCDIFESNNATARGSRELSNEADLQTVKVRVRYQKFADIELIEKWLESETRPSGLSDRCQSIKGLQRSAKWRLDSLEHTQRVLHNDQKRRAEQVALQEQEKPGPIKLVGFQRPESRQATDQAVIDKLSSDIAHERNTLEQLAKEWDREVAISNGFLQFSGAPKWFPVAESVGWRRGLAFIILACATWGICRFLFHSTGQWMLWGITIPKRLFRTPLGSLNMPHLGHVELVVSQDMIKDRFEVHPSMKSGSRHESQRNPNTTGQTSVAINPERWARGIVGSGFAAWAIIVAGRLVFDPAWRSLFVSAPLAALSNLISGVGL
ncbi:MAG: hypothetical protein MUC43_02195 [Pirellula sp.]|jgi:hypothetical protein|nr:hypothetical protein [Pirellula sp.]